jgi:FimV-like protein
MISLIIKSYLTILLSVGIGSIFIFILGIYFIFKTRLSSSPQLEVPLAADTSQDFMSQHSVTELPDDDGEVNDVTAIAGDDIMATQLDLAHAYIEAGKKQLARKILNYVVEQGNAAQCEEAQHLLSFI